jgi:antitoxin YefM
MNAITTREAVKDLDAFVHAVINDIEPTIVIAQDGSKVVVLPIAEYNSLNETDFLLSNQNNAAKLRRALEQVEQGKLVSKSLAELDL